MKTIKKEVITGRVYTNTQLHFSPQSCYVEFNIPKGFTKDDIYGAKNVAIYQNSRKDLIALKSIKTKISIFTSQRCKEYDYSYEQALVDVLDGYDHIADYIDNCIKRLDECFFEIGDRNYRRISGVKKDKTPIDIYMSPIDRYTLYITLVENPKHSLTKELRTFLEYNVYALKENNEKEFDKENKPLGIKEVFDEPTYKLESIVQDYMFLFQYDEYDFGSLEYNKSYIVGEPAAKRYEGEFKNYREYSWTGKKKFKDGISENGFFHTAYLYIDHKDKNDDGKTINKVRGRHQEWYSSIEEYIDTHVKQTEHKCEPKQLVITTKDGKELEYTMYELHIDKYLPEMKEKIYIHTLPNGDRLIYRTTDTSTSQKVLNKILGFNYNQK